MNKYWLVSYNGLYLGGTAVVIAKSSDEAIEITRNDATTVEFIGASAKEITPNNGVLYNDNGDY